MNRLDFALNQIEIARNYTEELPGLVDSRLDDPPLTPHPLLTTKFDSICWATHDEMRHAGLFCASLRQFGISTRPATASRIS